MRVLVVDDQINIRNHITNCLNQFGFNDVSHAVNGQYALEICRNLMPDIITLDWNMPLMDGLEFLKLLRISPAGKKPIVIFCSTEARQKKIDEVMEAGANAYITKPVESEKLRTKMVELKLL